MATRNINTFIEHLMNEAMTAAGTAGGGKGGKGGDGPYGPDEGGFGSQDFPQYNNPYDEDGYRLKPSFYPHPFIKPVPYDNRPGRRKPNTASPGRGRPDTTIPYRPSGRPSTIIPFAPTPVDPYQQKPVPPRGGGY